MSQDPDKTPHIYAVDMADTTAKQGGKATMTSPALDPDSPEGDTLEAFHALSEAERKTQGLA